MEPALTDSGGSQRENSLRRITNHEGTDMKVSEIYIIETKAENKSNYGDYQLFSSLEELQEFVLNEDDTIAGRRAWVVDLNKLPKKTVKLAEVTLV